MAPWSVEDLGAGVSRRVEDLEAEVLDRLAAYGRELGPELAAAFEQLATRIRLFVGRGGDGYFSHPLALPVLDLPRWAGPDLPGAVIADLAEASAAGYLRVRVEDDWFDEGIGEPGAVMMLAGALAARHEARIGRALRSTPPSSSFSPTAAASPMAAVSAAVSAAMSPSSMSAFWDLHEQVWRGYAEAMLLERRLQRGEAPYDEAAFRRVLGRSRPLLLPAAAALFAAGRAEALPDLVRFVEGLAAGHQLFGDLVHAQKDRALGVTTHALFRLGIGAGTGADDDARALGAALLGGMDGIVDAARRELGVAREAAEALGAPEAAAFVDGRLQSMDDFRTRIFRAIFTGSTAPPA